MKSIHYCWLITRLRRQQCRSILFTPTIKCSFSLLFFLLWHSKTGGLVVGYEFGSCEQEWKYYMLFSSIFIYFPAGFQRNQTRLKVREKKETIKIQLEKRDYQSWFSYEAHWIWFGTSMSRRHESTSTK